MILSIIKPSTNEIDTHYDSTINGVSIRMGIRIRNIRFVFVFDNNRICIRIRNKIW
jgi:hypothetical protein